MVMSQSSFELENNNYLSLIILFSKDSTYYYSMGIIENALIDF